MIMSWYPAMWGGFRLPVHDLLLGREHLRFERLSAGDTCGKRKGKWFGCSGT